MLVPFIIVLLILVTGFNLWVAFENGTLARLMHFGGNAAVAVSRPDSTVAAVTPSAPVPVTATPAVNPDSAKAPEIIVPPAPVADTAVVRPRATPVHHPKPAPRPREVEPEPEPATGSQNPATMVESHQFTETRVLPSPVPEVETGLLCGVIRDLEAHGIPGARVSLTDQGLAVVTDRSGRFCLTAPRGERTISVSARGFDTLRLSVVVGRQTSELSIVMHSSPPGSH